MGECCSKENLELSLQNATIENTKQHLTDFTCKCKCVSVYDGDTITLALSFGRDIELLKCRLKGIDSPEIRTKNILEKQAGLEAKEYLRKEIEGKIIWISVGEEREKYGRLLADIFKTESDMRNGISLNKEMIEKGYARSYDGGKKIEF